MGNISDIMEKVNSEVKMQVWNYVLEIAQVEYVSKKKVSLKVEECADIYVNCYALASWERLARSLYCHHQVVAVEEVRSYLPPRGGSRCGGYIMYCQEYSQKFAKPKYLAAP